MSARDMEDIEEYRDAFSLFDKVGDNKVEARVVGELLRALGLNPTETEVKKIVQELTPDKRITFEEFIPIFKSMSSKKSSNSSFEDFVEGFKVFDKDSSGYISAAELRHVLVSLGDRLTDEEVETVLQGMENKQGQVNIEEFVRAVMNG